MIVDCAHYRDGRRQHERSSKRHLDLLIVGERHDGFVHWRQAERLHHVLGEKDQNGSSVDEDVGLDPTNFRRVEHAEAGEALVVAIREHSGSTHFTHGSIVTGARSKSFQRSD